MIDHLSKRMLQAVNGYRASTSNRWLVCLAASRIVGARDGATRELAGALGLDPSQVENLARAGLFYRAFRCCGTVVQDARRVLTVSHFTALADCWKRYEPDPADLLSDLMTAIDSFPIPSVSQLRQLLNDKYNGEQIDEWRRHYNRARDTLIRLAGDFSIPDSLRRQTLDYLAATDLNKKSREIIIPAERTESWNTIWSSPHWSKRRVIADKFKLLVRANLAPDAPMMPVPVTIHVTTYFAHHSQDADNILVKPLIDGLKGLVLPDDNRDCVRSVTVRSELDKVNPRIVIQITSLS